jgi:hypothetical protein
MAHGNPTNSTIVSMGLYVEAKRITGVELKITIPGPKLVWVVGILLTLT